MDLGLAGKRALVLSSSRGLGGAVAASLVAEGAQVFMTARSKEKLEAAASALSVKGPGKAIAFAADLKTEAKQIFEAANAALGGIDILVANTGGPPAKTALDAEASDFAAHFEAMIVPVIAIAKLALPGMRAQKWGRIVTIASSGVQQPIPNLVISNALRSSLVGWSKTLAAEVAAEGITVNMVLPGRIETDRTAELDAANAQRQGKSVEEVAKAAVATIPAGRYGRPQEFADVVTFLASERAGYVTGSLVRVDGGAVRGI